MPTINAAALTYPFDRTGTATTNLVVNEPRSVGREVYRAIAPYAGSFYTKSMVVTDAASNAPLILNTDYKIVYPNQEAELEVGKPVCTVIMILNPQYTDVLLTYQAVGGPYTTSNDVIAQLLTAIQQDNRAVTWDAILGKPVTFNPSAHLHSATDLYGLEYVVLALEELVQSVYSGDVSSHDVLYDYINRIKAALDAAIVDFDAQIAGLQQQIDALTGRINALANTVAQLRADFTTHVNDKNNPHAVTQTQVGLGLVANYRIATQVEAETGTAPNLYMTVLTTWQAIAKYTALNITPVITSHINDKNNPHQTTAAQIGLGNVSNVPQVQRGGGQGMNTNLIYLGWDGSQILAQVDNSPMGRVHTTQQPDPNIAAHANRRDNPHGVTTDQIGAVPTYRRINGQALTQDITVGGVLLGSTVMWPLDWTPAGWLMCNGQDVGNNPRLRSIIGNNVPDMRGLFPRGKDGGRGVDPDAGRGVQSVQGDAMRDHAHIAAVETAFRDVPNAPTRNVPGGGDVRQYGVRTGGIAQGIFGATVGPENRPINMAWNFIMAGDNATTLI